MIMPDNRNEKSVSGSLYSDACPEYIKALWQILSDYCQIAITIFFTFCGKTKAAVVGYENMEVSFAHEHWSQRGKSVVPIMFLDVRSAEEYARAHISDATLIPVRELASRLREVPENRRIYVYCHSGWRSAKASALLSKAGYSNVVNVLGGIEAWQDADFPVIK